jgi:hypothetical protein
VAGAEARPRRRRGRGAPERDARGRRGIGHAATLRAELKNFRAKVSATGHDSYGAGDDWRHGNHDDLVLAVALSVWWGERKNARGGDAIVQDYAHVGDQYHHDENDDPWAEWLTPSRRR